jgi:hypothetical protein
LPNKAVGHTATLLNNGKVLVTGGGNSSSQLYDSLTNSWSAAGGISIQRSNHTATLLLNGKVLIAGGNGNNGAATASAQVYDPATGVFTSTGDMTAAREFQTATLLSNGKVLIAGGRFKSGSSYTYLSSAELYDPVTGVFTAVASMGRGRYGHAASLVTTGTNAGMVLIAGGAKAAAVASSELYNPATGTFSAAGALGTARQNLTATSISSGVLVAGGQNGATRIGTAEQYQGTAFVPGGVMKAARSGHTATLLNNGSVLIVGGQGSGGLSIASAELFVTTP